MSQSLRALRLRPASKPVHLSFAPRVEKQPLDSDTGPSIFAAVQEQLGLKLESSKQSIDALIIDHIESPAAN